MKAPSSSQQEKGEKKGALECSKNILNFTVLVIMSSYWED